MKASAEALTLASSQKSKTGGLPAGPSANAVENVKQFDLVQIIEQRDIVYRQPGRVDKLVGGKPRRDGHLRGFAGCRGSGDGGAKQVAAAAAGRSPQVKAGLASGEKVEHREYGVPVAPAYEIVERGCRRRRECEDELFGHQSL